MTDLTPMEDIDDLHKQAREDAKAIEPLILQLIEEAKARGEKSIIVDVNELHRRLHTQ